MIAYEFYYCDVMEGFHLLGILPERRKNPERITQESIINWGREIASAYADLTNLLFIEVIIDEKTGKIFYPKPFHRTTVGQ